eukprot:7369974-Alexandrium_andersonii.AAC.1
MTLQTAPSDTCGCKLLDACELHAQVPTAHMYQTARAGARRAVVRQSHLKNFLFNEVGSGACLACFALAPVPECARLAPRSEKERER